MTIFFSFFVLIFSPMANANANNSDGSNQCSLELVRVVDEELDGLSSLPKEDQAKALRDLREKLNGLLLDTVDIPDPSATADALGPLKEKAEMGREALGVLRSYGTPRVSLRSLFKLPVVNILAKLPGVAYVERKMDERWEQWREKKRETLLGFADSLPELRESMIAAEDDVKARALKCRGLADSLTGKANALEMIKNRLDQFLRGGNLAPDSVSAIRQLYAILDGGHANILCQQGDFLLIAKESEVLAAEFRMLIELIDSTLRVVLPALVARQANEDLAEEFKRLAALATEFKAHHRDMIKRATAQIGALQVMKLQLAKANAQFPGDVERALKELDRMRGMQEDPKALPPPPDTGALKALVDRMQGVSGAMNGKNILGGPPSPDAEPE